MHPPRRPLLAIAAFAAFVFVCLQIIPSSSSSSTKMDSMPILRGSSSNGKDDNGSDGDENEPSYNTKPLTELTPPLHTEGRYIVDATGSRVKLASVNWYGASDVFFAPMGLDFRHRSEIARTIREMGFNSVRFPYSDQMVLENPAVDPVHLGANLDLLDGWDGGDGEGSGAGAAGANAAAVTTMEELLTRNAPPASAAAVTARNYTGPPALNVFKACVDALTAEGIAVIINNHITNAAWCDGKNLCDASWKNSHYGPICRIHQTTQSWIANWLTVMRPHVNNPLVIGADLRNEPRGLWGTMSWPAWATAAEKAGNALHALQPNWLIFVEGISSANDCSGARDRPVELSIPHRVVYSAHVYAWSGWGSFVPYSRRGWKSFRADMETNWAFLLTGDVAPVWVGEFGASNSGGEGQRHYWKHLMRVLRETDADWGYWALNPRKPNLYGDETYGLLADDWVRNIGGWRWDGLLTLMRMRAD